MRAGQTGSARRDVQRNESRPVRYLITQFNNQAGRFRDLLAVVRAATCCAVPLALGVLSWFDACADDNHSALLKREFLSFFDGTRGNGRQFAKSTRRSTGPSSLQRCCGTPKRDVARQGIAKVYRNLKAPVDEGSLIPVLFPAEAALHESAAMAFDHRFSWDRCHPVLDLAVVCFQRNNWRSADSRFSVTS